MIDVKLFNDLNNLSYTYLVNNKLKEEKLNLEEIDESDIEKYSLDVVKQNIQIFKKTIDKFESYSYSYGCNWNANIKKLNLPEFQVAEIV